MNNLVLKALDTLKEYPHLENYIQTFDEKGGFMFTDETNPERLQMKQQLSDVLDDGFHSGASWACMLRIIQGVLCGIIKREDLMKEE